MQNSAASPLTGNIIAQNPLQNKVLTGIQMCAKVMLYHRNPAKVPEAELLINIMDGFNGNILWQSLAVETETVDM